MDVASKTKWILRLLHPAGNLQAFTELVRLLTRNRQLTLEMARREIADRFAGQVFGLFWAFGHPLIHMLIYVFVFTFVFRQRIGGTSEMPFSYPVFMLSGLIPWFSFADSMSKTASVVVNNANLVKQVVFPLEVLPVKCVLSSLFTQLVFTSGLLLYALIRHGFLFPSMLLLPVLMVLQALAMIGVSYILSSVGVYFRDIKDFVHVYNTMGFFLVPAIYVPANVPAVFRKLLYFNPFSYMVWCYQDLIYFGRLAHPWAWVVMGGVSLMVFVIGYRTFRKLKVMFGNVL